MKIITYDMIDELKLPIFNGVFFNNTIYEFEIGAFPSDKRLPRSISFVDISKAIKHSYIPCGLSSTYEIEYEDGLLLECGEGAYGSIGYVCLSKEKDIVFLACFEESNPFIKASLDDNKICATNNLGEIWIFALDASQTPTISITNS